jgi:hypothetical protein
MISIAAVSLWIVTQNAAVSYKGLTPAIAAIASGDESEAAIAHIKAAGKPGLWAMHDAAKKSSGGPRGRLFEALGRIQTPEAEWALIVELKGADPEGRAGAIRGLVANKNPSTYGSIARQADANEEGIRLAVVDALIAMGPTADKYVPGLLASKSENAREVGLRYLVERGEGTIVGESMVAALRDPAPMIQYQGLKLVERKKDRGQFFTVSELARSQHEEVAGLAVQVLQSLGGYNASSELVAVIADPISKDSAWQRAARVLRSGGADGFAAMLDAIARTKDDDRRSKLANLAVQNVTPDELARAVELLDDPAPARAAAGRAILMSSGEAGAEVAKKRLPSALPELQQEIESYLAERTNRVPAQMNAHLSAAAGEDATPPISRP